MKDVLESAPRRDDGLDGEGYLSEMVRKRGYVSRVHMLLAANDLATLKAYDPVPVQAYVVRRSLSTSLKEMCLVAGMTCSGMPRYALQSHLRKALSLGIAIAELHELIELLALEAGNALADEAVAALHDVAIQNASRETNMTQDLSPRSEPDVTPQSAMRGLLSHVSTTTRLLDARTKNLLLAVSLTCLRASPRRLRECMRNAIDAGVTPEELLQAIELLMPHGGLMVFEPGLEAWAAVTGAEALDAPEARFTRLPGG